GDRDDAIAPAEDVPLPVAEAEDALLEDADDLDGRVANPDRAADRVAVREEDGDRLGAEDRNRRRRVDVVEREVAALVDLVSVERQEVAADAANVALLVGVGGADARPRVLPE